MKIDENQAVGTVVGELNATDPDGDALSYSLASGNGDDNNSLFRIWNRQSIQSPQHSGLKLWLDASDASTFSHDAGSINEWRDKSGNANHATQSTASMMPALDGSQVNFDGGDILKVTNDPFRDLQNPGVFLVGEWNASSSWGNTFASYHGESSNGWQVRQIDNNFGQVGFTIRGTEGNDDSSPLSTDQTSFFLGSFFRKNDATRIVRHNGVETYRINDEGLIGYTGNGRSAIGGRYAADSNGSPGGMMRGAIKEIIVIDGASEDFARAIESYLAQKWAMGHLLPQGHYFNKNLIQTATTFDFEKNASTYSIRVQASDPSGGKTARAFSFTLADLFEDADGDGFSDQDEELAASNPSDPSSKPSLGFRLAGHWPLDGNTSDVSGNGNHGTGSSLQAVGDRHNLTGRASALDGNDYVSINHSKDFDLSAAGLTLSVWVSSPKFSQGKAQEFLVKGKDGNKQYSLGSNQSGKAEFKAYGQTRNLTLTSRSNLLDNHWTQISVTIKDGNFSMFLDGSLDQYTSDSNFSLISSADPLLIGKFHESSLNGFQGAIDDLRIYKRALFETEARALHELETAIPSATLSLAKLAPSLKNLIQGKGSLQDALPAGSVIAVQPNESPPQGYTLFKQYDFNSTLPWVEKSSLPRDRWGYASAVLDGKIYLVGGNSAGVGDGLVDRYDPATDQWEVLPSLSSRRNGPCAVQLNGKIHAIGGWGESSNIMEIFDPSANQWTIGPQLPKEIVKATAVSANGRIFLFGGSNPESGLILNDVWEYDPATSKWSPKKAMPTSRHTTSAVLRDGKIWVTGGSLWTVKGGLDHALSVTEIYDPITDHWTQGPSLQQGRNGHCTWVLGDKIYAFGGKDINAQTRTTASMEVYDPKTNQWSLVEDGPESKNMGVAEIVREQVFLFGGINSHSFTENNETKVTTPKVYAAHLPTPAMNLYFKEGNATTENHFSTLGASDGDVTLGMLGSELLLKLGLSKNPATEKGRLLALPPESAPPKGYLPYQSAFSSGNYPLMDLFYLDSNKSGTIDRSMLNHHLATLFDEAPAVKLPPGLTTSVDHFENAPSEHELLQRNQRGALHTWQEVAQVATARRSPNGGVSLNGKIYFIGGFRGDNKVERYDPVTNSWENLPALPVPRNNPAAVVLEGKIYVMGDSSVVNIFDPATNAWSTGVPLPTSIGGTSAITVEGKIYLMGGNKDGLVLKQNLQFDPVKNKWIAMANMPIPRHSHTLEYYNGRIWALAGDYMVYKRPRPTTTAQSYDPKTDSWRVEPELIHSRHIPNAWNANGRLFIGGSRKPYKSYLEVFNPVANKWESFGSTPYNPGGGGDAVLDGKIYLLSGSPGDGSFSKKVHAANLILPRDLYFRTKESSPVNRSPANLKPNAPLTIAENQSIGTFVGQFTASDADANATLSYRFVNGAAQNDNYMFSLETNGTLKTATTFDYESNASTYAIRVQVSDELNASAQGNFTVTLTDIIEAPTDQTGGSEDNSSDDNNAPQPGPGDSNATTPDTNATQPGTPVVVLFQPIVETGEAKKVQKDSATLHGSLVDNGGARITERGFLLSAKPNPKPGRKNVTRLDANGSKNFQAQPTNLKPGKKYYFRAFATNAQGTALGSVENFTTLAGPPSPSWINAQPGAAANWWSSRWFGNFYLNSNGWARHEKLGWVFPMESPTAGLWLWKRELGWLWTDKEIYPFLYQNAQGGWLYFYGQRNGTLLFYDYSAKGWISKEDRR